MDPRRRYRRVLLPALFLFAASMGCSSSDSESGAGGSSNTGGGSNTGTSTGTGGGTAGDICGDLDGSCFPGDTCHEAGCCPCSYACVSGSWEIEACPGCAAPICQSDVAEDGASCDECSTASVCEYEDCGGAGHLEATCSGGTWQVSATACDAAPPCGEDATASPCADDEVCVAATTNAGPTSATGYSCEANPCAPFVTSCECAVSLCEATGAQLCVGADARTVFCDDGNQ